MPRTRKENMERSTFALPALGDDRRRKSLDHLCNELFLGHGRHLGVALSNNVQRVRAKAVLDAGRLRCRLENALHDLDTRSFATATSDRLMEDRRRDAVLHGELVKRNLWLGTDHAVDRLPTILLAQFQD